jgi:hypothetical protein
VQWKNEMANRSYPYFAKSRKTADTWIHWLIDALLNERRKERWFTKRLDAWLSELKMGYQLAIALDE